MIDTTNIAVLKENTLIKNPVGPERSFRTEIVIDEGEENMSRVTFETILSCLETFPSGGYLVSVTTTNFKVNGFEPDLMMEQLAYKCRKPLEVLNLVISKNGNVEAIHNYIDIVEKWLECKERLEMEYSGENFKKYIALHEAVLLNSEALLQALLNDVFISQYFYPVYAAPYFNHTRKVVEKVKFFNINYELDMLLNVKENASLSGNVIIYKDINRADYNDALMPVEHYRTEYILDRDLNISNVKGRFVNYGRNYSFNIIEKYIGR